MNTNYPVREIKALSQLLLKLFQGSHQSHGPRGGTHHDESAGEVAEDSTNCVLPRDMETLRGPGQQHLGTRLTTGCLGGEKKVGKGMGLGCMGTNKHEKMEAGGTEGSGCMQNGANQYECVSIPWAWSSQSFLSSNTSTSFFFILAAQYCALGICMHGDLSGHNSIE